MQKQLISFAQVTNFL